MALRTLAAFGAISLVLNPEVAYNAANLVAIFNNPV